MDNAILIRLLHLRKNELRLTQKEFCSNINIDRSTLSNIEKGRNSLTERTIRAICDVYGVSRDWLLYGVEPVFVQEEHSGIYKEIEAIYNQLDAAHKRQLVDYMLHLLEEQMKAAQTADAIKQAALQEAEGIRQAAEEQAQAILEEAEQVRLRSKDDALGLMVSALTRAEDIMHALSGGSENLTYKRMVIDKAYIDTEKMVGRYNSYREDILDVMEWATGEDAPESSPDNDDRK